MKNRSWVLENLNFGFTTFSMADILKMYPQILAVNTLISYDYLH